MMIRLKFINKKFSSSRIFISFSSSSSLVFLAWQSALVRFSFAREVRMRICGPVDDNSFEIIKR